MEKKTVWLFLILMLVLLLPITKATAQDSASYRSPSAPVEKGKAPRMKWKLLSDSNEVKEYALIFSNGDEVLSGVTDFAIQQHIVAARLTAIGGLKQVTVAWYDKSKQLFKLNPVNQQVELTSMIGDVALYKDKPVVHIHCNVALADGSVKGGHLIEAITFPTVELFLTALPTPLQKQVDEETGLILIKPEVK